LRSAFKNLLPFLAMLAVLFLGYQGYELYKLSTVGTAIQARRLCSGLFVSRRDLNSILEQDLAPHAGDPMHAEIDYEERTVTSTIWGLARRKAIYREGLGCTLIVGATEEELRAQTVPDFAPLPTDPESVPWPTGNLDAINPNPTGVDLERLDHVIDGAFSEPDPEKPRWTRAVLVVHKDRIIAERYAPGVTRDTPLISWSMTKSIANALIGILVARGELSIEARAPLAEWDDPDDPRRGITLNHLLQMRSGLEFSEDYSRTVSDVSEMLYRVREAARLALEKPLKTEPGLEFYYSSGTTNILASVVRQTVGEENYFSFPREALFNRIGMRTALLCPDPSGTFVLSSYSYASARDWARFGLLYLHDGVWEGERILPGGWVEYTRTPTTARWTRESGGYGAQFWLNASNDPGVIDLRWPGVPEDAFFCSGHEGQNVVIIPSRDLVLVRLGMTHLELGAEWDRGRFVGDVMSCIPDSGDD
jgi:CubicO group peptidase (beta-lactamase class C family)